MYQFYIGIDLGGTNIRIITGSHNEIEKKTFQKKKFNKVDSAREEVEKNVFYLIDEAIADKKAAGEKLAGIGIATAALFERTTGNIAIWPNNKKWNGFPLKKVLEERYEVPVVLEDDANAAALGEQIACTGRNIKDLVYVTISTGIGSGIILNDSLVTGSHGWAGELGHVKVSLEDTLCTCGAMGCLQAVASGPAILKSYQNEQESILDEQLTLGRVSDFAAQGDEKAIKAFSKAGDYIGKAIANVAMLLDINQFILGGGVMNVGNLILLPICKAAENSLQNKRNINIRISKLNDKNGLIGALALIDRYVNHEKTLFYQE